MSCYTPFGPARAEETTAVGTTVPRTNASSLAGPPICMVRSLTALADHRELGQLDLGLFSVLQG